jgi:hypothetical protein
MSIGASGRIVIEVSPHLKRELYAALARDGMNLKSWFLRQAEEYLSHGRQRPLNVVADATQAQLNSDRAVGKTVTDPTTDS